MSEAPDLFTILDHYIAELFAPPDDALEFALQSARTAGLPEIQVSATQGKFIYLLAKIVGARRILEVGHWVAIQRYGWRAPCPTVGAW